MNEKVKDELELFKKKIEHAIIGEYEWFVSWSAENIETDMKEYYEAIKTDMATVIKLHENTINTLENKVEEMQKVLEWYANEKNYDEIFIPGIEEFQQEPVLTDNGERARASLKHLGLTVEGIEE